MKYKTDETSEQFAEKEAIVAKDLRAISEACSDAGLTFWLTSGTLLGCISRGSILPMDRDVDLGTWETNRAELDKAIIDLQSQGFQVTRRYDPEHDCEKGMVTLIRGGVPIDIKVYTRKGEYMVRGIHQSHSVFSQKLWDLIDLMYFRSDYSSIRERRKAIMSLYCFVARVATMIPRLLGLKIVKGLCAWWRRLDVTVGLEVLPVKYPDSLKTVMFYGTEVRVFESNIEYLDEEYGPGWDQHNPNGKGGTEKFSHILKENETYEEAQNNPELKRRCQAIGYMG